MTDLNSMLGRKSLAIVAVSLAVVFAAIAAIVVSGNRADEARAYADAEIAESDLAAATNKAAQAEASAARAREAEAEANRQAKADELAKQKELRATAEAEQNAAEEERKKAEEDRKAAEARSEEALAQREAAIASNQTVRAELDRATKLAAVEQAKADAESAKLATEKLKSEAKIAEKTVLELRKTNYEDLERELLEWKLELEERERALKPEKTVADLAWAGGVEDSVVDDKGNLTKLVKTVNDPEKDMTLSRQTRRLAKATRKTREAQDAEISEIRENVVKTMEDLYVLALKEGRVIDADFYKKNILIMYPDWKFQGEDKSETGVTHLKRHPCKP